ncbi:hypothetical protein ACJX0J_018286, partial [Zea mays]
MELPSPSCTLVLHDTVTLGHTLVLYDCFMHAAIALHPQLYSSYSKQEKKHKQVAVICWLHETDVIAGVICNRLSGFIGLSLFNLVLDSIRIKILLYNDIDIDNKMIKGL